MFELALENSFDFRANEYQLLFNQSRASAFQHPIWLDRLYRRLVPALAAEPLVVTARRRGDGQLALVLPLVRRRHRGLRILEFADLGVTDYAAAVCDDAAFEALAQDARTGERLRKLLRPYDLLRIKKVLDDALPLERLFANARRTPMGVNSYAAELFEPFSDWRKAKMPKTYARNLGKKRRQMNRLGVVAFERLGDPRAITSLMRDLQTLRGQRFLDDVLKQESYFDFYSEVALAGASTGFARAYRMSLDGRSLGGLWGISHKRRFLALICAVNCAAYPRQSIGALAFEDAARDCIAEQDAVLDFTLGDESYKQFYGGEPSPLWMVSASGTGLGVVADKIAAHMFRPQRAAPVSPRTRQLQNAKIGDRIASGG